MSLPARRARIARVRALQHVAAAGIAADAASRVAGLEGSAERLGSLRAMLLDRPDAGDGRTLANMHELAARLDVARDGLSHAIRSARAAAEAREAERIAARIDQEGAERLRQRAAELDEAAIEARAAAMPFRGRRQAGA